MGIAPRILARPLGSTDLMPCIASEARPTTSPRSCRDAGWLHALECLADVVEGEHLIDRQLQLAAFHRRAEVVARFVEDLVDLLDRAGAEGDADIADPASGGQVEFEVGGGPSRPTLTVQPLIDGRGAPNAICKNTGSLKRACLDFRKSNWPVRDG